MYEKEEKLKGAHVFKPPIGKFRNVAIFDMSRYYPSIIIAYDLSPEGKNGILPELCKFLMRLRDKYEKEMAEAERKYGIESEEYATAKSKRNNVKYLLNAVFGYVIARSSRIYKKDIGEAVLKTARRGLYFIADYISKYGYKVLYGDTDSIMIQVKDLEEARKVEKLLNQALKAFCESDDVKPMLRLKFERFCKYIIFVGVKKRYAARVIVEGGEKVDYVLIKGFEFVRSDTSRVTRSLQKDIIHFILYDEEKKIVPYLRKIIHNIRTGRFSLEEIAIRKTMRRDLESYEHEPDWIRGIKYAMKHLGIEFVQGDQIKILYVKRINGMPPTDIICFLDASQLPKGLVVDYDKIIEKTVKKKVEKFLKVVGLSWSNVIAGSSKSSKTLSQIFG